MAWARRLALLLGLQYCAVALAAQVPSSSLTFQTISAGLNVNTCAVTTSGAAYCWGINVAGELGTSARVESCRDKAPCATHPIPVEGGHTFTAIAVGEAVRLP